MRLGRVFRDEMRAVMAPWAAVGATALIIGVAIPVMAVVSLLVFVPPVLATHVAFRRLAAKQASALRTVRGLARVLEVGGYVAPGQTQRVCRLSMAIGQELAMPERQITELEFAALMHDIGQFMLPYPIPGGATLFAAPDDQQRIAAAGAEMIRQTGQLDQIVDIVSRQYQPYQPKQTDTEPDSKTEPYVERPPQLASRIIKVATAYDDMAGEFPGSDRTTAILELLRLDRCSGYDPSVIEALHRTITNESLSAHRQAQPAH